MTRKDIYDLVLKSCGLFILISGLNSLKDAIYFTFMSKSWNFSEIDTSVWLIFINLFYFAFIALLCYLLIFKTDTLLNLLPNKFFENNKSIVLKGNIQDAFQVIIIAIALYFAIIETPLFISQLLRRISVVQNDNLGSNDNIYGLWTSLIRLTLIFFLIFKAKAISTYLLKNLKNNGKEIQ